MLFFSDFEPSVPIGFESKYNCPEGSILKEDFYRAPYFVRTCGPQGDFGIDDWMTCVDRNNHMN